MRYNFSVSVSVDASYCGRCLPISLSFLPSFNKFLLSFGVWKNLSGEQETHFLACVT